MVIHFETREAAEDKLSKDGWIKSKRENTYYSNGGDFIATIAWIPNSRAVAVYYGPR